MDQIELLGWALALGLGGFVALWPLSLAMRDASVVDAWWGPGAVAVLALVWALAGAPDHARAALLFGLVALWGLRLGLTLIRRRVEHGAEDSRYQAIRRSWGSSFWWKSLFIVFLLQGALQFVIVLAPVAGLLAPPAPLGALGLAGALVAAAGLMLEAQADRELDRFKARAQPGALLTTGLRAHVRHPAYTGEIAFWWGVFLIAAEAGAWWAVVSPLLLTFLLTKVSGAPMTGESLRQSKPGYAEWAARTPAFLPRLRRRETTPAE